MNIRGNLEDTIKDICMCATSKMVEQPQFKSSEPTE